MKSLIYSYSFLFLCTLLMVGCDKENDNTPDAPTLDAFLATKPELSFFAKALDKAGLGSFKSGPGPFTWFAPSNAAFTAAGVTEDSLNKMTAGQVNYLLLYHLANRSLSASNMVAVNSSPQASQLGSGNGQFYIGSNNGENFINGSKIIDRDNKVSNGYVHVLNRVNIPPVYRGNIASVLSSSGQHTLFIQALTRAGLYTSTTLASTSAVFTVFAPTDAAMTAAGYTSTSIAAATPASLSAAMRYHYILNTRMFTNDLNRTTIPATALSPSSYITSSDSGQKIKGRGNPSPVSITKPDILATNGVVHVIDAVLKP